MKNHLGLIVAIVLGVIGATLNFLYLTNKAANFDKVAFLSIDSRASIKRGETFREDHFAPLEIPKVAVSSQLSVDAILFSDRGAVVGMKATRDYGGGEMVLQEQLKTPPSELALTGENERAMWVPVDTRTFVPSLIKPGDTVSFLVPRGVVPVARAPEEGDEPSPPPPSMGDAELVGPFKVLSVGNRLGSAEVFKAAGMPQQQENVLTISVHAQGNQLDPMAKKLWDLLQAGGFRQAGVILHPRGLGPN
ncbi:MAG TPA: hypothetical protein VFB96_13315 [Pirellulaceae bacterium]|nr:hypothetical protein [Pirellulaceae bacterium]